MVICTVEVNEKSPQTIVIGRRGTYNTQEIVFDIGYLIDAYGAGTAVLAVKRSQDSSAYPTVVTQEDTTLTWTVSETDTYYVGAGECQLMWYVDGGLAKTIIYPLVVMRDILSTSEEAPDAYQEWVDDLTALGAETLENAQNAAQSASDAESAKDDAVTAKEAAENAQEAAEEAQQVAETAVTHYPKIVNNYWYVWANGEWVNTGVKAEGVDGRGIVSVTGQKTSTVENVDTYTMTVAYTSGNPDTFTFTVTNGVDGYSPVVTITAITGGHRVTITDETHPTGQSFDVMNGEDSAVLSVAGKTGNVTLNANDVAFSESGTYDEGTVGAEVSAQKNAISQLQPTATASDVGKALIVKAVDAQTRKPTEYEYGEATVWDAAAVSLLDAVGNSLIYKDEYGGQYFSSLITLLRSRIQTNTYTITIASGHYVADNDITSIYEGLPYVCTLTPTQGFQFTSVTVTMGETAVIPTENYDGTYTINITSVMGDISISAETEGSIGNIIFRTQNVVCDGTQPPIETGLMFGSNEANGVTSNWTFMITAKSTATGMAWYKRPFSTGLNGSHWSDNSPTSSNLRVIGYNDVALNPLRNGFVSCVLTHVANEVTKLTAYYIDKDSGDVVSQICEAVNITYQLNSAYFGAQMLVGANADGSNALIGEIKDAVIYDVVADAATISAYLLGGNS